MNGRMYGVVLWADARDTRAVIWCEDHGSLAYYSESQATMHRGVSLDAGDLITFDLREDHDCRRASNLARIDQGHAPGLARTLRGEASPRTATVLPFTA